MFLHAGDNVIINEKKILMIIDVRNAKKKKAGTKSIILLTDGKEHSSRINSSTLKHRIERGALTPINHNGKENK